LKLHLIATGVGITMMLPFLWMVLSSLKTLPEVSSPEWSPKTPQWSNYSEVFQRIPYARFLANSLLVAGWTTLLQVATSAMAAYSFSRLQWKGRDKFFFAYLATMMLPGLVMMVPNYQVMIRLGLMDTLIGLILPASFSAFGTFLLRQFMLSIPTSLDESAEIDGAGKWRIFFEIILPLSRPGLITLAVFTFLGTYNSFFWPLVMLRSVDNYTLPVGMLYFDSVSGNTTHLLMAAATMSAIPMILIFIFFQRYMVEGIQAGAVKG
jgi:ABC-type glycerol-3-phosphate transport system permease component